MHYHTTPVHISGIRPGDTILFDGHLRTVCDSDIKFDGFTGITIFGDSYRIGMLPVHKVVFHKELTIKS